jgi:4-aminobutyrate aminotransferase-like enzyme
MEPPLLVSEAEIDEGVGILAGALEAVAGGESI